MHRRTDRLLPPLLLAATLLLAAATAHAEPSAARGRDLLQRFQCARCHDGVPGAAPVVRDKHCVNCHTDILSGAFQAPPAALKRWQRNITHLTAVPDLHAAQRFDPAWIAAFLLNPSDLRPRLDASMPRLAITPAEAQDIAAALTEAPTTPLKPRPAGDVERGLRLLGAKNCLTCHTFTGAPPVPPADSFDLAVPDLDRAFKLAPDLRYARQRLRPDLLAAWLLNPQALKPTTPMPRVPLNPAEAEDLAAAILRAPLQPLPPPPPLPARLPTLKRPVAWEEVEARVFKKVCWHCHADPAYADGDGGPGNTGGFGFTGRRVSFASYEDSQAGRLDDQGQRASLFATLPDGTPFLVAVLLARHQETRGATVPGLRGMPLGLPPLPMEDIQLIESWIAQGRPR